LHNRIVVVCRSGCSGKGSVCARTKVSSISKTIVFLSIVVIKASLTLGALGILLLQPLIRMKDVPLEAEHQLLGRLEILMVDVLEKLVL
jgi:hypothetical protein